MGGDWKLRTYHKDSIILKTGCLCPIRRGKNTTLWVADWSCSQRILAVAFPTLISATTEGGLGAWPQHRPPLWWGSVTTVSAVEPCVTHTLQGPAPWLSQGMQHLSWWGEMQLHSHSGTVSTRSHCGAEELLRLAENQIQLWSDLLFFYLICSSSIWCFSILTMIFVKIVFGYFSQHFLKDFGLPLAIQKMHFA